MKWFHNLMVGVFFFGALGVIGYFTILSESSPFIHRGTQMIIYFENSDGIKKGSRVSVLGVPSGRVKEVDLISVDSIDRRIPNNSPLRVRQKVAITIEIDSPLTFYENYLVAIKNESVLAGKIISIHPGSAFDQNSGHEYNKIKVFSISAQELEDLESTALHEEMHQRGAFLKGDQTAAFDELHGETTSDPIAGLSEIIEDNRENVRKTIDNVASITEKINRGQGTLGQLVNDRQLHKNTNTLVKDGEVVVKELRESLEDTREQAPVTSFLQAIFSAF